MKQSELLKIMEKHVQKYVTAWQSDFYDYDINTIERMRIGEKRIWSLRDTGTYLTYDPFFQDAIINSDQYDYFAEITRTGEDDYSFTPLDFEYITAWIKYEKSLYVYVVRHSWDDEEVSRYKSELEASERTAELNDQHKVMGYYPYYYTVDNQREY